MRCHVQEMAPEVTRQLDLMRAVFRAEVPAFGSCWGVQQARPGERGPAASSATGSPPAYDVPAIYLDAVVAPPPDCDVLASNEVLPLQAVEIRH